MKGLILAGGLGTRLYPLTKTVSKQLLAVYDKPMIYFPLATLMLAGIRDIAVVSSPEHLPRFEELLGDGARFGIQLSYIVQSNPRGLADAYIVAEDFLEACPSALILGDNLFYGVGLGQSLATQAGQVGGANVLAAHVSDPESYGILKLTDAGSASGIVEKPKKFVGDLAIPGLYFLDGTASERAKSQSPSVRGELEIVDLLMTYLNEGAFNFQTRPRGTVWLDMGTPDGLAEASDFVRILQRRQGVKISCPEEIALRMGYLDQLEFEASLAYVPEGSYRNYLASLLKK
jgi:glucose-1-phosphate thymidylyltransferase